MALFLCFLVFKQGISFSRCDGPTL